MTLAPAILATYLAFFAAALVWPSVRVWRRTGHNPLVLPRDDSVEGFVGLAFKLAVGGLGLYLAGLAAGWWAQVGPIASPARAERAAAGWALIGASLAWVILAQWQMGSSWRVGIDRARPAPLVRSGLFRFSRNPIFFGMMVQLVGLIVLLPDAMTATVLVGAFVLISVQIRLEEHYLRSVHGPAYDDYAASVRRWI